MSRKLDSFFLIEWGNGERHVVNYRTLLMAASDNDPKVGSVITFGDTDGVQHTATVIAGSRDRQSLEEQIAPKVYDEGTAGPSAKCEEDADFSASGSSWAPSEDNASSDDEEVQNKKIKLERYSRSYSNRRTSKVMKPTNRVTAINAFIPTRKRAHKESNKNDSTNKKNVECNRINKTTKNVLDRKSLPDSTRKNNSPAPNEKKQDTVTINVKDIMNMKQCFKELFKLLKEMKPNSLNNRDELSNNYAMEVEEEAARNDVEEADDNDENVGSDYSNRSDDNVLISNKYVNIDNKNGLHANDVNNETSINNNTEDTQEWIPIGSGKTLIHKDRFRKVNFKSYTIATRTLLLAVFPRRILATHSMTGKRSPAFQDKPAKMCLDPKIVSDVIIEITDRFKVRENLVRSIITTKCADESKMYKMRLKRKTMPSRKKTAGSPAEAIDGANQTC